MSPRGIAIPEVREKLFEAAERVLTREGPGGLTGRSVTREAACATGLLYSHFGDFDEFLVQFVLDRARLAEEGVSRLLSRAGEGTLTSNLEDAATAFGSNLPAIAQLVTSRSSLMARLREEASAGWLALRSVERAFAAYLEEERKRGRIAPSADTEALALALVGAFHHLFSSGRPDAVGRVSAALAAALAPSDRGR